MKIKELLVELNAWAPFAYQESYDNTGLILGSPSDEVKGILINLDATREVVDEAVKLGANVLITHHPILFAGTKKILDDGTQDNEVIRACIKNDINLIAMHTNLDAIEDGVNAKIGEKLGLKNYKILAPKSGILRKLVTFAPAKDTSRVLEALFEAGAGSIANYDQCAFETKGKGGFRPLDGATPTIGSIGNREVLEEDKIEVIYEKPIEGAIVSSLMASHPYEEVAYDILELENKNQNVGMGMIGEFEKAISLNHLMDHIKKVFHQSHLNYIDNKKPIRKVAYCGGSGSFLIETAMSQDADVYITADMKYHDYFRVQDKMSLINMGHYEMEQFTSELILEFLSKKNDTFAVHLSQVNTNPVAYY